MWVVEDFRDAPMRPRAMFEKLEDAQEWATRLDGHAHLTRQEVMTVSDVINVVRDALPDEDVLDVDGDVVLDVDIVVEDIEQAFQRCA